jgi:nicotinamide riboside transporter PnuC
MINHWDRWEQHEASHSGRVQPIPDSLSWIFPLGMAAVVLLTGNHRVLDIAGSAVLPVVSITFVSA